MPRRLALTVLMGLAACGTPQERCIQRETRDLRILDRLIHETEANLARGYALEQITLTHDRWVTCPTPPLAEGEVPPPPRLCLDEYSETITRPKAINLDDEADKLASQKRKRAELENTAQTAILACKSTYPE